MVAKVSLYNFHNLSLYLNIYDRVDAEMQSFLRLCLSFHVLCKPCCLELAGSCISHSLSSFLGLMLDGPRKDDVICFFSPSDAYSDVSHTSNPWPSLVMAQPKKMKHV